MEIESTVPQLQVAPSPHLSAAGESTRRMMVDVLIALVPVTVTALAVFQWYAVKQLAICIISCLLAEAVFTKMRRQSLRLGDLTAVVTGAILAFSLPGTAPWYVGFIAAFVAMGIGKIIFGGLGMNLFNPAMVGRAFVMIAFAGVMGASGYQDAGSAVDILSQATPLTAFKQSGIDMPIMALFLGVTNGSLGETSALACLAGGIYLCIRRTASWEIPVGVLLATVVVAGIGYLVSPGTMWSPLHHLLGGALLFGAFFIATDPVSSPLTPKGKFIFGAGIGGLVMVLRLFSGYPEGVMFAVLLMNGVTPLINRWTIPTPLGGEKGKGAG
jgi:electron transport complex protein RnfD